jgi:hypothetical protein
MQAPQAMHSSVIFIVISDSPVINEWGSQLPPLVKVTIAGDESQMTNITKLAGFRHITRPWVIDYRLIECACGSSRSQKQ